jgi:hypothetical protein
MNTQFNLSSSHLLILVLKVTTIIESAFFVRDYSGFDCRWARTSRTIPGGAVILVVSGVEGGLWG